MNSPIKISKKNWKVFILPRVTIFGLFAVLVLFIPIHGELNRVQLNMAHGAPQDHPLNLAAVEVQNELTIRTNDQIQLEVFSNMQFGEEAELVEMLCNRRLDLAVISTGPLADYNPDLAILDLPYLFNDRIQAYQAWDGEPGAALLKRFDYLGLEGFCFWENGLRSLTTKKTSINTPADLKNIYIRTMENLVYVDFFSYLGALPTPMPWGQVVPSLQVGIIEAQENPIPIIVTNNLENYQHFLILTKHVYNPYVVLAGPSIRAKLNRDQFNLVKQTFCDFRTKQRQYVVEHEIRGVKILQDKGMVVIEPDLREFRRLGRDFSKSIFSRFSKETRILFERYIEQ